MVADEAVGKDIPIAARDRIQTVSKKNIYWLMGLLVIYVIIHGVVSAAATPFNYDELLTLAVASQSNVNGIWNALSHAVDSHPPLFYLFERVALKIVYSKQIALRLPSILALPCTLICVFMYIKKRNSEFIAFLCAVFILLTSLFHTYGVDARAYGMVIACIAFALFCYSRAPSPFWTIMLSASLILAESLHYYSVFSMTPFWVAETVYIVRAHRFRWGIWVALVLGPVPLWFFWPLLSNVKAYYGAHIWTHYGLSSIPYTYGSFFLIGIPFGFAVVAVCAAGIGFACLPPAKGTPDERVKCDQTEAALLFALLALPFTTALATKLMHGAMHERYVQASVLGIVLAMACVMSLGRRRVVLLFTIFVFSSLAISELSFWRHAHSLRVDDPAPPAEALIRKAGHPDLPVVVSDGITYLQLAYYASPEWKKRFVFLADSQKALQHLGTDSVDKSLMMVRLYMPLQVDPLSEFAVAHPTFLFYVEDPGSGFDWLPSYFPEEALSMQALAVDANRKVYLVTMKGNSSP